MLTAEEVRHVAQLARIRVTDEEIKELQTDLSKVLVFFQELETVNTDQEEPIGHITGRTNKARIDEFHDTHPETLSLIKKNFPEAEGDYLKVHSVL